SRALRDKLRRLRLQLRDGVRRLGEGLYSRPPSSSTRRGERGVRTRPDRGSSARLSELPRNDSRPTRGLGNRGTAVADARQGTVRVSWSEWPPCCYQADERRRVPRARGQEAPVASGAKRGDLNPKPLAKILRVFAADRQEPPSTATKCVRRTQG